MKPSTVSVVIATHGRRDKLRETLGPLLADPAADEIVVVDDGSTDGSLEVLEDLAATHPQLRPVSTRHRGRAAARQLGLERATGEVVLLLDDDVVATPGLVDGHARAHAGDDGLVVVGYMPIRLPACRRPGDASTYLYAGNYEGSCLACERDPSLVLTGLWGGNVSICRADALRVGMDSSFTYHEDRDFGLRCMKAGLHGRFDRSLHAEHVHARSVATLRRDARGQGAGRVKIHLVHADVLPPFDGLRFVHDLPAPLRRIVIACRRPRLGTFCAGVLAASAGLAGRLRLWQAETNLVKLLRRVELQRGALDALEHS
ncbi:MAG TPA: glycosyltransferase [Solirubrobacteraceae bacterium]|nr:glycosyltransferase [Solirubrobacteraceae bacterium]